MAERFGRWLCRFGLHRLGGNWDLYESGTIVGPCRRCGARIVKEK